MTRRAPRPFPPAALAVAVALAACGGADELGPPMTILVHTPPGSDLAGLGASHIRVTVEGGDLTEPVVDTFPLDLRAGSLGAIPYGLARQVTVEALGPAGADGSQAVLARGRSLPTEVQVGLRAEVHVYVTPVGQFAVAAQFAAGGAPALLADGRVGHTVTPLSDGRILIAGGAVLKVGSGGGLAIERIFDTLEVFDPATGQVQVLGERLHPGRAFHTATRLRGKQGYVLIAGGMTFIEGKLHSLLVSDVFSPEGVGGGTLFQTENLWTPRARHQATLRHDGAVLVTGGAWINGGEAEDFDDASGAVSVLSSAELFRVSEGRYQARGCNSAEWTYCLQGAMATARVDHAAVRVGDAVMAVGGRDGDGATVGTTEMFTFDEAAGANTGVFQAGPRLNEARADAAVVVRSDDVVVVAGGAGDAAALASVESYDPRRPGPQFSLALPKLGAGAGVGRSRAAAAVLDDDTVLLVGGQGGDPGAAYLPEVWLLGAADSGVADVRPVGGPLPVAVADAVAVTMGNGAVILVGGRTQPAPGVFEHPTSLHTLNP